MYTQRYHYSNFNHMYDCFIVYAVQDGVRRLRDLVAALSRPNRTLQLDLHGGIIEGDDHEDGFAELLVYRTMSFGALVKRCSIAVPVHGALLLDGQGARFEDVVFSGGATSPVSCQFFP